MSAFNHTRGDSYRTPCPQCETPGYKLYRSLSKEWPSPASEPWEDMPDSSQKKWERIAAAVTAPESKSLGQVAYETEAGPHVVPWRETTPESQTLWEHIASNVIAEYRKREGLDPK